MLYGATLRGMESAPKTPFTPARSPSECGMPAYWCCVGASVPLVVAWAWWGGPVLARALAAVCFAGLLGVAALVAVNLALVVAGVARRLGGRRKA